MQSCSESSSRGGNLWNKKSSSHFIYSYESGSTLGNNIVGASVIIPDASDGSPPENPYDNDGTTTDGSWNFRNLFGDG